MTDTTPLRELPAKWRKRDIFAFSKRNRNISEEAREAYRECADELEAALSARDEAGAVACGACGKEWDGQKCGQAENGWPFPVCYPIATPPASGEAGAVAVAAILAALNVKPIGQFYPGHTADESEQANEAYYGTERREQVFAEIARLREIERRCWHLLDDAGDDGESISFSRNSPDYLRLDELLPDECPGCRCDRDATPPAASGDDVGHSSADALNPNLWVLRQIAAKMPQSSEREALLHAELDLGEQIRRLAAVAPAGMNGWIPVSERLPPDGDCVLCYEDRKGNQFVSQFLADLTGDGKPGFVEEFYEKALTTDGTQGWGHWPFVTHWQPLPTPPATAGKE